MKPWLLIIIALACASCAFEAPTDDAAARSALFDECVPPAYNQVSDLALTPLSVTRAHQLVNKMWGAWPKPPGCVASGTCPPQVPATCNQTNCATFSCFGWTCQMTDVAYSPSGLRVATLVSGLALVDAKFAQQPQAGGLTSLEAAELGVARAGSTILDGAWCQ